MFDVRRLVVFILESCLESPLDGKCHIYDSLYLLIHYAHFQTWLWHMLALVWHMWHFLIAFVLACILLWWGRKYLENDLCWWFMIFMDDRSIRLQFPLTPAPQLPAYKPTSSKRPQITLGYCFLPPFLFLPLCCWTTLFKALFHAHPFMTIALSINN